MATFLEFDRNREIDAPTPSFAGGDAVTNGVVTNDATADVVTADSAIRFGQLLGVSNAMLAVFDRIGRVAPTQASVLIHGETGTGKELVARTLHDLSSRSGRDFVAVNCAAMTPSLVESELFGHEKGSFTGAIRTRKGCFEIADGGTLFLDEITEMPLEQQAKLLRVLETRRFSRIGAGAETQVDVRVLAATNIHPDIAVARGKLRSDLLYRLSVFPIEVPPLRLRVDDIALLSRFFVAEFSRREHRRKLIAGDAIEALQRRYLAGNVRELKNLVYNAFIMSDDVIRADCIPAEMTGVHDVAGDDDMRLVVGETIATMEKKLILATLARYDGDKPKAAAVLGVSLKTLYNRLKEYSIQ